MLGAGNHPRMKYRLRVITGQGVRRGDHVGGVVDIRQMYGWCNRVSRTIPNNFRVRNKFIRSVYRYRAIIGLTAPEGDGSMFGMLEEGGRPTDTVFVFYAFF